MKSKNPNKYHVNIDDLADELVKHGSARKRVFINNSDTVSSLTQFAFSRFDPGDTCEIHVHPTMDEHFFVHKGNGLYYINDTKYELRAGDFIFIPAGTEHYVKAEAGSTLELVYFGIAIGK